MLKKVVSLFIAIVMSVSTVLADTESGVAEQQSESTTNIYQISLADAINMALEDNPQLNACEIKKENYKTQLSAAKITKSKYKDVRTIMASTGYEVTYIKGGYYVDSYQSAVDLCDYEYRQISAGIAYNVTQKYFNYKNCEKIVNIAENSYNLVEKTYADTMLSYNLGLVAKNDLDNVELSMKKAANTVELYKNNYELAKEDLKIALRKNDENCDFMLTDNITCEDFSSNLEEDLKTAEQSRYDIAGLKSSYELSKRYLELTALPSGSATYTAAYSNYITSEYNYTNNKSLILLGIKSSYNNISSTKNDMDVASDNLELVKNSYNISKIKYEQGMITNSELAAALNSVSQAEIELENAKLSYKLAVEKYKYEISIGL